MKNTAMLLGRSSGKLAPTPCSQVRKRKRRYAWDPFAIQGQSSGPVVWRERADSRPERP